MFWNKRESKTPSFATAKPGSPATHEVFTPSVPAERGFVGRSVEMNDLRTMGLNVPGAQVVVWGESGAGKSSLIIKALSDVGHTAVKTACTPESTYEEILEAAFAGTGAFTVVERTDRSGMSADVSVSAGGDLIGAKVQSTVGYTEDSEHVRQPIARPQLSAQRLVAELGARGLSWVVEDFHKMHRDERFRLAHALKVFADEGAKHPATRVIVIGVSDSVDELVDSRTNVGSRLIDVEVPPLGGSELREILDIGEELLSLDFEQIRDRLLMTSVGTASITHALALACCNQRGVFYRADEVVRFTDEDFEGAVMSYARTRSGTLKARFRRALLVHRERTYNNPKILLSALAELPENGGTIGEVLSVIRRETPTYPSGNATNYLRLLQNEERGALIRKTSAGKFRFDEPLQHAFAKTLFGLTSPTAEQAVSYWEQAVSSTDVQARVLRAELEEEPSDDM